MSLRVSDDVTVVDELSVLMTVKNVIGTIERCLDSIESQKYGRSFEIVIVDAASTDGTTDYLKGRARSNRNLRLFVRDSSQPEALSHAFNERLVSSKYVALIDGDAVADENWLSELLASMRKGSVVAGGPCLTPKGVNLLQRLIGYDSDLRFMRMVEGEVTRLPNMNLCVDREFFARVGFDLSFPLAYDMELGHRLSTIGKRIYFNPRAVVWHYHRSSIRAYVKQQVQGSKHALRVFRKYPNASLGDNINSLRMLIDAPFLSLLVLSVFLLPFGFLFSITASLASACLLISISSKTCELMLKFRKSETVLCAILYLVRSECWLIGLLGSVPELLRSLRLRKSESRP